MKVLKGSPANFKTEQRKKDAQGSDFDGCCDIQSPVYKQKGPMKNKIGVYSGDIEAKNEVEGDTN